MGCPGCAATSLIGGSVGSYFFGIDTPKNPGGKLLSVALTTNLTSITVIGLQAFFHISLCAPGGFTLGNVVRVTIKASIISIIYTMAINYLLNIYLFRVHPSHSLKDIFLGTKKSFSSLMS